MEGHTNEPAQVTEAFRLGAFAVVVGLNYHSAAIDHSTLCSSGAERNTSMNTSLKNKLLVCDLDGTLLDAQGQIDEKSLTLIKEFCAAGGHFVVCTGRMDTDIQFIEEKLWC